MYNPQPSQNSDDDIDQWADPSGVGAEVTAPVNTTDHIPMSMFQKPQKVTLSVSFTASPNQLAENPSKARWKMAPHIQDALKYNAALHNRDKASGDQLLGKLDRVIPLHMKLVSQQNTFPYFIGLEAPNVLMNNTLYESGKCLLRVPPATSTMAVDRDIFQPVNMVTEHMYRNLRMATPDDLAHDVKMIPARGNRPGRAAIATNSLAHQTLQDSLHAGLWQNLHNEMDIDKIFQPGMDQFVEVPESIGKEIVTALKGPLEEAAKGFVNMADFEFRMVRADAHKEWTTPKNIHNAFTSESGTVSGKQLSSDVMQQQHTFSAEIEMHYITF